MFYLILAAALVIGAVSGIHTMVVTNDVGVFNTIAIMVQIIGATTAIPVGLVELSIF